MSLFACHHRPDRTLHLRGRPLPVCARCTGLYAGYGLGLVFWLGWAKLSWPLALLLVLPLAFDGLTQRLGWRESNNVMRLATGLAAGLGYMALTAVAGQWLAQAFLRM